MMKSTLSFTLLASLLDVAIAASSGNYSASISPSKSVTASANVTSSANNSADCSAQWATYWSKDEALLFSTTSTVLTYTTTNYTASVTTLCDGEARIIGSLTPTATGVSSSLSVTSNLLSFPVPTCSPDPSACSALVSSYSLNNALWCNVTTSTSTSVAPQTTGCGQCILNAGQVSTAEVASPIKMQQLADTRQVELFYFPVAQNKSRNLCGATVNSTLCPLGPTSLPYSELNGAPRGLHSSVREGYKLTTRRFRFRCYCERDTLRQPALCLHPEQHNNDGFWPLHCLCWHDLL